MLRHSDMLVFLADGQTFYDLGNSLNGLYPILGMIYHVKIDTAVVLESQSTKVNIHLLYP
jgi:hypothetical protein